MTPHPIRAADGIELAPNLEHLAGDATDVAVRCRDCGKFFWTVTDVGGKYEYVDAWELDSVAARAAFIDHDANALARIFVGMELPKGPVWSSPSALVEIFRALTPGLDDVARATAIESAAPRGLWALAAHALAQHAATALRTTPFAFSIDLATGLAFTEWFEVGEALVLFTGGDELLRLDARGLVRLPMSSPPKLLASSVGRALFAANGGLVVLDADGNATAWPREGECSAMALDGDHWLVVPSGDDEERWIEFHLPDGRPRTKIKRRFARGERFMPAPRRLRDGWIVSDLIDDDGVTQALTLFDDTFTMIAQTDIGAGERDVIPVGDAVFWATTRDAVERWERRGALLERTHTFAARSSCWLGDMLVAASPSGELIALAPNGSIRWRWTVALDGAMYTTTTHMGLLVYGDSHAVILSRRGEPLRAFDVDSPCVFVGRGGTVYMKSLATLFVITSAVREVIVGLDARIETTFGDDVVVRRADGTVLVIGHRAGRDAGRDGTARSFDADGAAFSVVGAQGAWVVSGGRVRATPPLPPDARALAHRIASRLGALGVFGVLVRELPSDDARFSAFTITLADGSAPVLVRDHVATKTISIEGGRSWSVSIVDSIPEIITEVVRDTRAWASAKRSRTMCEKALHICALLGDAFGERWTVAIPGTPNPSEMWVSGEAEGSGSIGIFPDRQATDKQILATITRAHERHARSVELAERLRDLAAALAARLEGRFSKACVMQSRSGVVDIAFADAPRERILRVSADDEAREIHVHAGPTGPAGFSGGADAADHFDEIATAVERVKTTLTIDRLVIGRRYRVLETLQGLEKGDVVRFDGMNYIDNHYGECGFTCEAQENKDASVTGDFSTHENSPLGETYRYLEEIPD